MASFRKAISVELRKSLAVSRGKLTSGAASRGTAVHAATYLREGKIVLDSALLRQPSELKRILIHELFHFVWWKLGNPNRFEWERILAVEIAKGARGELGWSAELRKNRLSPHDKQQRTRRWRDYCCESFCDTGASLFLHARSHDELTLAKRFQTTRRKWLSDIIRDEEHLAYFVDPKSGWDGFRIPASVWRLFSAAPSARRIADGTEKQKGRA